MALNLEQKKAIVNEVSGIAQGAKSAIAVENLGLSVSDVTVLRSKARKLGLYLKVVPNNLAKRALMDTDYEAMNEMLYGPIMLAFSDNELGAPAKLVKEFIKSNDKLKVRIIAIGNKLYSSSDLDVVASLPTKEEAIAKFLAVAKAPIGKFVRTIAETQNKLLRVLIAIRDSKS